MNTRIFLSFNLVFLLLISSCTPPQEKAEDHYEKGRRLLIASDAKAALIEFEKGLKYVPDDALLLYSVGNCYMNFKDYKLAVDYYTKALKSNPKYADAYFNRGRAWFYLNDRDRSCHDYQMAHELGKPNVKDLLTNCNQ